MAITLQNELISALKRAETAEDAARSMLVALIMAQDEFKHIGRRCLTSDVVDDAIEGALAVGIRP